jgi:Asp-tRNA(Asn)/Glu-tRNA(Gln) amidotransferase C subunit
MNRRAWMKLIPALAAPAALAQNPPAAETPQKISKDVLHQALSLAGLEFSDEQEQMMLTGINRNLANYDNLRKIDIPLDTEPATRFYPTAPRSSSGKFQPPRIRAGKAPGIWLSPP